MIGCSPSRPECGGGGGAGFLIRAVIGPGSRRPLCQRCGRGGVPHRDCRIFGIANSMSQAAARGGPVRPAPARRPPPARRRARGAECEALVTGRGERVAWAPAPARRPGPPSARRRPRGADRAALVTGRGEGAAWAQAAQRRRPHRRCQRKS